jgi:D-sedoheptulose 7-phosphate isomerase
MIDTDKQIDEHIKVIEGIRPLMAELETIARAMSACLAAGAKILWMGNGGSAADSQHMAAEFVGRYTRERRGLASIALTTDTSILTAVGNDYGYERVFARQIEALCRPDDVVVGMSTSGNSPNVVQAVEVAKQIGATTVGFTGATGGELKAIVDHCLTVPATSTARIQEAHILMGHLLCDWVEAGIVREQKNA